MSYTIFKKRDLKQSFAVLIMTVLVFASVIGGAAVAFADDISILEVSASPNTGVLTVGQTLQVNLHHPDHMDDITVAGACTVNGKDATPLQNLTAGDYRLAYTVAEGDNNVTTPGAVPFSCALTNSAGQMNTLTAFTDNNTVTILATTTPPVEPPATTTSGTGGTMGGNVEGGTTTGDMGTLTVTGIEQVRSTGTADGNIEHGWKWVFHITVPSDEQNFQMKFATWMNADGVSTINPANNMRISSPQAGSTTVIVTGADTYTTPLTVTGDLNGAAPGKQIDVTVEMAIPVGSVNGAYSTTYHVKTTQP